MIDQKQSHNKSTGIKILASLTTLGLFFINLMGFVDTETGSTFGCGHDWPLCNGQWVPSTWGFHTIVEYGHRAIVGFVTLMLILLSVWALVRFKKSMEVKVLVAISFVFVMAQAALGAMAVFFVNPPAVIALHFGFSLLAFSGVLLLNMVIWKLSSRKNNPPYTKRIKPLQDRKFARWVWGTIIYIYGAIYFGAYISSTDAGSHFRGWPLPTETYAKAKSNLWLDYIHRSIAFLLVLLILNLCIQAYRMRKERSDLFYGSLLSLLFVFMQAFSGAYLVFSHISLSAFLTHVSVMTFLFGSLSYLGLRVTSQPVQQVNQEWSANHKAI